jgi:hypothetical protein
MFTGQRVADNTVLLQVATAVAVVVLTFSETRSVRHVCSQACLFTGHCSRCRVWLQVANLQLNCSGGWLCWTFPCPEV